MASRRSVCALLAFVLLAACGTARSRAAASLPGDPSKGAALFEADCRGCHQGDGLAKVAAWTPRAQLIAWVIDAPGTQMPSFAHYTDQDLADIAAHLEEKRP